MKRGNFHNEYCKIPCVLFVDLLNSVKQRDTIEGLVAYACKVRFDMLMERKEADEYRVVCQVQDEFKRVLSLDAINTIVYEDEIFEAVQYQPNGKKNPQMSVKYGTSFRLASGGMDNEQLITNLAYWAIDTIIGRAGYAKTYWSCILSRMSGNVDLYGAVCEELEPYTEEGKNHKRKRKKLIQTLTDKTTFGLRYKPDKKGFFVAKRDCPVDMEKL